jgi:hypothetical protein
MKSIRNLELGILLSREELGCDQSSDETVSPKYRPWYMKRMLWNNNSKWLFSSSFCLKQGELFLWSSLSEPRDLNQSFHSTKFLDYILLRQTPISLIILIFANNYDCIQHYDLLLKIANLLLLTIVFLYTQCLGEKEEKNQYFKN